MLENEQTLIMSPSLYKEWRSCGRKALINSHRFLGNIHTCYGRAYEYGARLIIDELTKYQAAKGTVYNKTIKARDKALDDGDVCSNEDIEDMVSSLIVGSALMKCSHYLLNYSSEPHKEKNVFTLAIGLNHTYYFFKEFLVNNKVLSYEERTIFKGANFIIGGAYDLEAVGKHTNVSSIYDFKGITSLWNYAFPTSPQIPIYTVLKQMALLAVGSDKKLGINGGYLINLTSGKKTEEPFVYVPVNSKLVVNNLKGMMDDFILRAKELHKLQKAQGSVLGQYLEAPVGLDTCSMNYGCYQINECSNGNFALNTFPDDRVFDRLNEFDFSTSLLTSAIKVIKDNTTDSNLVDGDGVGKADMFDDGVIEEYYAVDDLKLNEL